MKEFEENITEGWTLYSWEDPQRAADWLKIMKAAASPAKRSAPCETEPEREINTKRSFDRENRFSEDSVKHCE